LKSGGLNLLEASGLVQACTGIALPFFMYLMMYVYFDEECTWGGWYVTLCLTFNMIAYFTLKERKNYVCA
jgi:hypothetical protein